jgi:hypothetical protein
MEQQRAYCDFESRHWSAWALYRKAILAYRNERYEVFIMYLQAAAGRGHKDAIEYMIQFQTKGNANAAAKLLPIVEADLLGRYERVKGHPRADMYLCPSRENHLRVLREFPDDAEACFKLGQIERARRYGMSGPWSSETQVFAALYNQLGMREADAWPMFQADKILQPLIPYLTGPHCLFGNLKRCILGVRVTIAAQYRKGAIRKAIIAFLLCFKVMRVFPRDIVLLIAKEYLLPLEFDYNCIW